jgi:hypothetical protein
VFQTDLKNNNFRLAIGDTAGLDAVEFQQMSGSMFDKASIPTQIRGIFSRAKIVIMPRSMLIVTGLSNI